MARTGLFLLLFFIVRILSAQDNQELKKMFDEDQNARKVEKIDWTKVSKDDERRRARVEEMIAQGLVKTSKDYFYTAMFYQHGNDSVCFKKAWEYSKKAVSLDPNNKSALWLTVASYDRYLLCIGKPQIYGTQFLTLNNKLYLRTFDSTKVTDKERTYYGTRTIKEIRDYLTKQNGEDKGLLMEPKNITVKFK
jgi:hypothetical protein